MFLKKINNSAYYRRICENHKKAIEGYPYGRGLSESILPSITQIFNRLTLTKIDWYGNKTYEANYFESISEITLHISLNTQAGEVICGSELEAVEAIFKDLNGLIDYVIVHKHEQFNQDFNRKLQCLNEIACKNMVNMKRRDCENDAAKVNTNGKIFRTYENLYKVFHRINIEWDELIARGFSRNIWFAYRDSFEYNLRIIGIEKSEEEKLNDFMGILDGTVKLIPQYEIKAVSYQAVSTASTEKLIRTVSTKYDMEQFLIPQKSQS